MKTRLLLFSFGLWCTLAVAEDAYYHVSLTSLGLVDGKLPTNAEWSGRAWRMAEALQPYAVLDGDGEAFLGGEALRSWAPPQQNYQSTLLTVHAPKAQAITGRLFLPNSDLSAM